MRRGRRLAAAACFVIATVALVAGLLTARGEARTPPAPCTSVDVMGDSIMTGDSVPYGDRWSTLLQQSLPSWSIWTGAAVNGSATEDFLPGGPQAGHVEFTVNRPSVVLMDWRINDQFRRMTPEQFRENYQAIISRIHYLAPDARILLINTPWVYNPTLLALPTPQTEYAAVIDQLGEANGLNVIHLEWGFPGDDRYDFYTSDLIHHTAAGQRLDFTVIRDAIMAVCP